MHYAANTALGIGLDRKDEATGSNRIKLVGEMRLDVVVMQGTLDSALQGAGETVGIASGLREGRGRRVRDLAVQVEASLDLGLKCMCLSDFVRKRAEGGNIVSLVFEVALRCMHGFEGRSHIDELGWLEDAAPFGMCKTRLQVCASA